MTREAFLVMWPRRLSALNPPLFVALGQTDGCTYGVLKVITPHTAATVYNF